jgi:hypothetical protein
LPSKCIILGRLFCCDVVSEFYHRKRQLQFGNTKMFLELVKIQYAYSYLHAQCNSVKYEILKEVYFLYISAKVTTWNGAVSTNKNHCGLSSFLFVADIGKVIIIMEVWVAATMSL